MSTSLSGVMLIWKTAGDFVERNLRFLVSFSAGVFLWIVYELIGEITEISSFTSAITWSIGGVIIMTIIFALIPEFHHHHIKDSDHSHSKPDARKILLGDAIHNFGDGILLAAAFLGGSMLGILTAVAIFVHEIIQELSEFFVLKEAGYSTKKALTINFIVSSTIPLGAIVGLYLSNTSNVLVTPLLGIAAGSFLYVVAKDLVPHSIRSSHENKQYLSHTVWFLTGIIAMFLITGITPHAH